MRKSQRWAVRVFLAFVVGLMVVGLSLYVAWGNSKSYEGISQEQSSTRYAFARTKNLLNEYKQLKGAYPKSLSDLDRYTELQENGWLLDGWNRPLEYKSDGNDFLLTARGADGVAGGIGIDSDLTSKTPRSPQSALTFSQWWHEPGAAGVRNTSLFGGILAFLSLMLAGGFDEAENKKSSVLESIAAILLLLAILVPVTTFISLLHLPTGH